MRQTVWGGMVIVLVAGGVCACAMALGPLEFDPSSSPPASSTNTLDKSLFSPEIWRLPPVAPATATPPDAAVGALAAALPNGQVPTALVVPPAETIPAPPPTPLPKEPTPTMNLPLALPDIPLNAPAVNTPLTLPPRDATGAGPGKPPQDRFSKLWDGTLSVGLDGTEGNTETFNLRCGFHGKRTTEQTVLTFNADYLKQTTHTIATADRLYSEGRYEWLFKDSPWSCFVHETVEYDEFQPYNVLDTADAGFGYRIIKSDTTTLIGRFGGGFSNYWGGPDDGRVFPEAVFGMNLERQISKRQKFLGSVEYAPDVAEFLRYRLRAQAALEVLLDEEKNLSMRMGVLERYNSLQQNARLNDVDYAMVLLWKF